MASLPAGATCPSEPSPPAPLPSPPTLPHRERGEKQLRDSGAASSQGPPLLPVREGEKDSLGLCFCFSPSSPGEGGGWGREKRAGVMRARRRRKPPQLKPRPTWAIQYLQQFR